MSKTVITLPPNPKPAKDLAGYQQAVTVWTRQAEQTVREIGRVADTVTSALATTSVPTGSTVLHGAGVPSNSLGNDGNYYIDSLDLDIFLKTGGVWSILAPLGSSVGSLVLNGAGVPSSGLGNNGNYYIDTTGNNLYFKVAGAWSLLVALGGGSVVLNGSGVPSAGLGSNGNYYIDSFASNIYFKSSGTWSLVLTGASPKVVYALFDPNGTGSITTSSLAVAVPSTGFYRITIYSEVHTASAGSVTFTFSWTDDDRTNSATTPSLNTGSATNILTYTISIKAVSGSPITYFSTASGVASYRTTYTLERLI